MSRNQKRIDSMLGLSRIEETIPLKSGEFKEIAMDKTSIPRELRNIGPVSFTDKPDTPENMKTRIIQRAQKNSERLMLRMLNVSTEELDAKFNRNPDKMDRLRQSIIDKEVEREMWMVRREELDKKIEDSFGFRPGSQFDNIMI